MKRNLGNAARRLQFIGLAIMWFFLLVCYGYLNFKNGSRATFLLTTVLMVVLSAHLLLVFMKRIYQPILKIRDAIRAFDQKHAKERALDIPTLSNNISNMLVQLKESMNREYTSVLLKKQAEFAALQSQINPHFLYNTLDSIRGEALMEGSPKIAEMTEALSTFFRYGAQRSYWLFEKFVQLGTAIVIVSSNLTEVSFLCDRLLILKDQHIAGEFLQDEIAKINMEDFH